MSTTQQAMEPNKGSTATDRQALLSPTVIVLGALLALQLLAALVLGLRGNDMEPAETRGRLLQFEPSQVTGVRVEGPNGKSVLVTKAEDGWIVPALGDLPAAELKVSELLSKLAGLERGLPVATSEQALKRFKVAEEGFERRVTLQDKDTTLATLYLGDSPGIRRLFVRADSDEAVYEAELGLFDAPDKADAWSDRTLLHLDRDTIQRLTLADLTLESREDDWRLADLAEGEEQDTDAIEDRVRMLAGIDFVGVLGADEQPTVSEEAPPFEIEAQLNIGETVRYRISKLDGTNDYLLDVSNRPQRFRLAAYTAEELTGISRADLLQEVETDQSDTGALETDPQSGEKAIPSTGQPAGPGAEESTAPPQPDAAQDPSPPPAAEAAQTPPPPPAARDVPNTPGAQ